MLQLIQSDIGGQCLEQATPVPKCKQMLLLQLYTDVCTGIVHTALYIQTIAIHNELRTVFGGDAPSFRTVARCAQCFCEDRDDIQDEERSGRPVTETIPENGEQVRNIVVDNPYVTIEELQDQTGLSYGTVHRILSNHLKLRIVTARYESKQLIDSQRNERVRIYKENLSRFEAG
ncbi:unnamed protein product [Rotaria sp. Silwood1]|nr:unnamed protein product [Rotaria sp. Silwood1]